MYNELGRRVVAADLDPQANLTAAFLDEDRLEALWDNLRPRRTILGAVEPLLKGVGDVADPVLEEVADLTGLVVGDLLLSGFEDELSGEWPGCMDRKERSFRVISAFWRILHRAVEAHGAHVVLLDVGPNLGAINRAALIAADYVVVPLAPDLFSLQGLRNLGPTLRRWREEWRERLTRNPNPDLALPPGRIEPIGYIVLQHQVRLDRPTKAYDKWIAQIPGAFREAVLDQRDEAGVAVGDDPWCLALLKHYRSLMPLAQDARKPIFLLKPADGAIGLHLQAAQRAWADFRSLAMAIAGRVQLPMSEQVALFGSR